MGAATEQLKINNSASNLYPASTTRMQEMHRCTVRRSKKRGEVGKEGADHLPLPQSSLVVSSSGTSPSIQPAEEDVTQSAAGAATENSSEKVHDNPRGDRKRSWVWEHFEEYTDTKVIKVKGKEDIIQEFRRAKCIYCPKGAVGDYACDSYKNGTQGMIRHINNSCKYYPGRRVVDKNQKLLVGDKSKGNSLKAVAYNPDEVMQACVEMVVVDELPFSFVEKQGFRKFCYVMQPLFKVPCRKTLVKDFLKLYDKTKKKLKSDLSHHRVYLTTDTWTSVQNFNYMVLTAHFIDDEWVMHKRIINFCTIHNHSGNSIGMLIESCLIQWGINKVLTITVDNAAANKCALEFVRSKLNKREKSESILEGKFMHVRCTAHICNLIVGSGLKRLNRAVLAIRNAVKFVRSSSSRLDSFKACVAKEQVPCKGLVVMDVPTRWNSTFLMLEAALKFKKAFGRMLEETDSGFAAYFSEPEEEYDEEGNPVPVKGNINRVGPPTNEEWDKAEVFVHFLRVFYEVTLRVSASNHPTIHTTFHDVLSMETEINKLFIAPEMQTGSETEKVLTDMAGHMSSKFLKYYGSFKDLNPLVFMGLVLDPRFKLLNITHLLKKEGYDNDIVEAKGKELRDVLMSLYEAYAPKDAPAKKREVLTSTSQSTVTSSDSRGRASILSDWRKVVSELDEQVVAHEVDKYLLDPLEYTNLGESDFPILLWWKLNGPKYPVLAAIAKDVLAVQVSTVASEAAFSTGGRVIDNFRSSLTPKSVEALICLQSWLRGNDISHIEDVPGIKETEFYEKCEKDHISSASSSVNSCPRPPPKAKGKDASDEVVEVIEDESENSSSEDSETS
ncbi:zinc finger BED domain-containing protein RICESLEEPER 4-like [Rosa rugosa]|uniref:zinc finger BED domain-containing protein RICESLEEPER 4-like n=1 Tax=Rosa rugosa TaxID=74645 RepID=UPI002B41100A|nr:zinc finger BED domain-containing protein RICESLEEPER 4-like [Rosa rugosa]